MAITAVYDSRSGTAPVVETNAAPSEHEHPTPMPTAHLFRRQDDAPIEGTVAPRDGKSTDVALPRLSVPILIVIAMMVSGVTAAVSASGVYWMLRLSNQQVDYQMQSDIRSIREGLASQSRIEEADKRADAAELKGLIQSYEGTKQSVDAMRGIVQLLQLQVAELLKQRKP